MTRTGEAGRPPAPEDRVDSFVDWASANRKMLTAGAVGLAVVAGSAWIFGRSVELKAENAERTLVVAEQTLAQGNLSAAQSELEKVVVRYPKTAAGVEARMMLAQLHDQKAEYQQGIELLEKAADVGAAKPRLGAIHALAGDGHAELGQFAEAAAKYDAASKEAEFELDQLAYRVKAAYAHMNAGNREAALAIWTDLAKDPLSPAAGEAKIRLGELQAKPAGTEG